MQEAHSSEPDRSRGLVLRNDAGHEIVVLTWAQYLELARPSEGDRLRDQLAHDGLPVPLRVAGGRARRRSPWSG